MSEIRCPRRQCRSHSWRAQYNGIIVSEDGAIQADSHPSQPLTRRNPFDAAPPHYVCLRCHHRWRFSGGQNRTLDVEAPYRLYDPGEISWLVRGLPAGWRPEFSGNEARLVRYGEAT